MKKRNSSKGIISIAFIFILLVCVVLASMVGIFWSKVRLSGARLQRFHAKAYAEAALNEAVKRFYTEYEKSPGNKWNINNWPQGYSEDPANAITIKPSRYHMPGLADAPDVLVKIYVTTETIAGIARKKISATVDYSGIKI